MKRSVKLVLYFLSIVALLVGAYIIFFFQENKEKEKEKDKNEFIISSEQPQKKESIKVPLSSYWTGLGLKTEEKQKTRPIAVMINNIKAAQPLCGVSKADVLCEMIVEGGITRVVAIFHGETNVREIGSVRSARPCFINFANGFDSILMHIGGSEQADEMMEKGAIDHFNLSNFEGSFWRSEKRSDKAYEHRAVTRLQNLEDLILRSKTRSEIDTNKISFQKFGDNSQVLTGEPAKKIEVIFSNYKSTTFDYNEINKTYLISQFDDKMTDGEYNCQVSKENVIVIKARTFDLDEKGHKGIEFTKGSGLFFSRGKKIDINWQKSNENSSFEYTLSLSGEELIIPPGTSYICVISLDAKVNIS